MPSSSDVEDNKIISAIGYISVLCLIPLLMAKDSPFAQFHAKQGVVLFIAEVIVFILNGILAFIPFLGWLVALVLNIGVVVFAIWGIIKALQGEKWEMPILGPYAKKLKL